MLEMLAQSVRNPATAAARADAEEAGKIFAMETGAMMIEVLTGVTTIVVVILVVLVPALARVLGSDARASF